MQFRSISRELSLLLLGQFSENNIDQLDSSSIEIILNKALDTLMQHWKDQLDHCATNLEMANDQLSESEYNETHKDSNDRVRKNLTNCLTKAEYILNSLLETMDLVRLLSLGDQDKIKSGAIERVSLVIDKFHNIDSQIDTVMEGWRLKRLPRIDRDILRLAYVDLNYLNIPIAVACNEAVNLANRYSDEQGRKMINGILRRLQKNLSTVNY